MDSIYIKGGSFITVQAGTDAAKDYVEVDYYASQTNISTGKHNDTIFNHGDINTIDAGADNDRIINSGTYVKIYADAGNDRVGNTGSNVTINAGAGNDSVFNSADSVNIYATGDNVGDFLYTEGNKVNITAGTGADSIITNRNAENVTIKTGDGNNGVSLFGGENISVTAGSSNDSIILYGEYDGKNIYDDVFVSDGTYCGSNATLNLGGGENFMSISSSWHEVTVNGSAGNDSIMNYASNALINVDSGKNTIENGEKYDDHIIYGNNTTIQTANDDDLISNIADKVSINAGGGSNTISNGFYDSVPGNVIKWLIKGQDKIVDLIMELNGDSPELVRGGDYATITSGKGDDLIINRGSYASISSGAGKDRIISKDGENNIIKSGGDNDKIIVYHDIGSLIIAGSGNDEIVVNRVGTKDWCEVVKFVYQQAANKLLDKAKSHITNLITNKTLALASYNQYVVASVLCAEAFATGWEIGSLIKDIFGGRRDLIEEFASKAVSGVLCN